MIARKFTLLAILGGVAVASTMGPARAEWQDLQLARVPPPPILPNSLQSGAPLAAPTAVRATDLRPDERAAVTDLVSKGVTAYEEAAFSKAINDLENALLRDPHEPRALYYLANAYWRLDELPKAEKAFAALLAADPTGPFAQDARIWLRAQGNVEAISVRPPAPDKGAAARKRPGGHFETFRLQDGRTRLNSPPGWAKIRNNVLKGADDAQVHVIEFRKSLGKGSAIFVLEARHGLEKGTPESDLRQVAVRICQEQAFEPPRFPNELDLPPENIQYFDTNRELSGPIRGSVREIWNGSSLLIAALTAPKAAWNSVQADYQTSMASLQLTPASRVDLGAKGNAIASPKPTPSGSPTPKPTPPVPTFFLPRPGEATLPPGLYPAPWATRIP